MNLFTSAGKHISSRFLFLLKMEIAKYHSGDLTDPRQAILLGSVFTCTGTDLLSNKDNLIPVLSILSWEIGDPGYNWCPGATQKWLLKMKNTLHSELRIPYGVDWKEANIPVRDTNLLTWECALSKIESSIEEMLLNSEIPGIPHQHDHWPIPYRFPLNHYRHTTLLKDNFKKTEEGWVLCEGVEYRINFKTLPVTVTLTLTGEKKEKYANTWLDNEDLMALLDEVEYNP